jgi:prepilin-type N-terminal cleavage/methylation domain-containing protein
MKILNKKLSKGFTLIELLVVIAIIGILSSVVLASLNSARSKGQLASFKSEMKSFQNQAEIFYLDVGSYVGMCSNGGSGDLTIDKLLAKFATYSSATVQCNATGIAGLHKEYTLKATFGDDAYCADASQSFGLPGPGFVSGETCN